MHSSIMIKDWDKIGRIFSSDNFTNWHTRFNTSVSPWEQFNWMKVYISCGFDRLENSDNCLNRMRRFFYHVVAKHKQSTLVKKKKFLLGTTVQRWNGPYVSSEIRHFMYKPLQTKWKPLFFPHASPFWRGILQVPSYALPLWFENHCACHGHRLGHLTLGQNKWPTLRAQGLLSLVRDLSQRLLSFTYAKKSTGTISWTND